MTTKPAPQTCSSPAGSPALPTGMCRRDLLVAAGALLMAGGAAASTPTPEAFLCEHRWTFGSDADMAGKNFCTRFGLVHFGRLSANPPQPNSGGNPQSGWQACSDLTALARTSDVLFLTGLGTARTRSREAIASSAHGLVVDLRAGSQPDVRSHSPGAESRLEAIAAFDFVRAYVQQVVAFDLEDARAALSGHTPCEVAVRVCSGEKSAITASTTAAERVCSAGREAVRGQLLLLTFGSTTGCLRLSKEAFSASAANLPASATSLHAVSIDTRLPSDAVRATVLTASSDWGRPMHSSGPVLHAT